MKSFSICAAVASTKVTSLKSNTCAVGATFSRSSTEEIVPVAPKKNAPEMRWITAPLPPVSVSPLPLSWGTLSTPVVSDMRCMNNSEPSTTPAAMPSTRSTKTVRPSVTSSTAASPREALSNAHNSLRSAMFQATTARIEASAASGTCAARGAAASMVSRR
jgi:hypothetical protein